MTIMFIVGLVGLGFIALAFYIAAPRVGCGIIGALLLLFGGGCLTLASNQGSRIPDGVLLVGLLPAIVGAGMLIYAFTASSPPQDPPENKEGDT